MTEQLNADLHRAASAPRLVWLGPQHVSAVAQPRRPLMTHGVSIHARYLGSDISTGTHQASGELISKLESLQIQGRTGTGQQRVEKLYRWRHDLIVSPVIVEIEQRSTQLFHTARLRRQYFIHAVGQQPAVSNGHGMQSNKTVPKSSSQTSAQQARPVAAM